MWLETFEKYLTDEKKYSKHTVVAYQKDISQLMDFLRLEKSSELKYCDKKDIRMFLAQQISEGRTERSVNRKLSSLKTFFGYLHYIGALEENPAAQIKGLKHYPKVQIPLSEKETEQLLEPEVFSDDFSGVRDSLMLELLFQTGMRRSELMNLELRKIDFDKKEIKILGKRKKERIVPVTSELLSLINKYVAEVEKEGFVLDKELLLTDKGMKLYPKYIYNKVKENMERVTSKNKKSPHILRHSFATQFLKKGAELNAVKEILGHSSLAATQVYTHNDIEQLKKVFNHAHPREHKKND